MKANCSITHLDLAGNAIEAAFTAEIEEQLEQNRLIVHHIFPAIKEQERKLGEEAQLRKFRSKGKRAAKTFAHGDISPF